MTIQYDYTGNLQEEEIRAEDDIFYRIYNDKWEMHCYLLLYGYNNDVKIKVDGYVSNFLIL
jgi:hypothetical protein